MFAELFDEHAHPLHRYLARRVGVDVADDLVSETFLAAMRGQDTYDPEKGSVVSQSSAPVALSNARNFRSKFVAPMKTSPPAVTIGPP